ncbi:MAG: hypothetical protein ACLP9L_05465 [Thermoguttaceae bacterium]
MTTPELETAARISKLRWYQLSLAETLALMIVAAGFSMLKWFPVAWPFVADFAIFAVAFYVDRHFSPRFFRMTSVRIIVALLLIGLALAPMLLGMR